MDKDISRLKIKCNEDFRGFKKGEEFEIFITPFVTYLVGPNGCGKSALFHYIRSKKDSLREILLSDADGVTKDDDRLLKDTDYFTIDGLDSYDYIFSLDSIDDDPMSLNNAITASSYISGGGYYMRKISKGQKAVAMIAKFMDRVCKFFGVKKMDEIKGVLGDKKCLVLIDEVDEGMDLKTQMKFDQLICNIGIALNGDVLCVCHNILCLYASLFKGHTLVFDVQKRKTITLNEYTKDQIGYTIQLNKEENNGESETVH